PRATRRGPPGLLGRSVYERARTPRDALFGKQAGAGDSITVPRDDADGGKRSRLDRAGRRTVRPYPQEGRAPAARPPGSRLAAASEPHRTAAAAWYRLVRAELQRRNHHLAIRDERERVLVTAGDGALARVDGDPAGE